jgi:hypothetical protein
VGKLDVYGGPDGSMGEQAHCQSDISKPPNLLHRNMAQEAPVFGSHGQAIAFQEGGTGSTRTGISRGRRRRDVGKYVCTPPRSTQIAN